MNMTRISKKRVQRQSRQRRKRNRVTENSHYLKKYLIYLIIGRKLRRKLVKPGSEKMILSLEVRKATGLNTAEIVSVQ